ncbi:hypothetical protein V440_16320 [Clostridioides difficile]|nr:hypothetical protein V440_16320 [Clostridioides difficile]
MVLGGKLPGRVGRSHVIFFIFCQKKQKIRISFFISGKLNTGIMDFIKI